MARAEGIGKDNGEVHLMSWVPGVAGEVHALCLGTVKGQAKGSKMGQKPMVAFLQEFSIVLNRVTCHSKEVVVHVCPKINGQVGKACEG